MDRRTLLSTLLAFRVLAASELQTLRGRKRAGAKLELPGGVVITLAGDDETMLVLGDARLDGLDFEVAGRRSAPGVFQVEPIHIPALFLYRDGKRLRVSYWCDVCYIRTWAPGLCWCCRKETLLDPREES
ncbi:MAG: hypothetical protein K2X35_10785 [Bryobacteraceae bacterium]|nr:hypothetical protein [Bryobacteraceae bacterium]